MRSNATGTVNPLVTQQTTVVLVDEDPGIPPARFRLPFLATAEVSRASPASRAVQLAEAIGGIKSTEATRPEPVIHTRPQQAFD